MPKKIHLSTALVVTALTINSSANALCKNCFEKMNKEIARITQKIDRIFSDEWIDTVQKQAVKDAEKKRLAPQQKLAINQEGDTVAITLRLGTGITNINAHIKDDQISVEIPEKNQQIFLEHEKESNYLSIMIGQSTQKKEEKEGAHREAAFFSSMQHGQSLNQPIEFGRVKIDYKDNTLTISFPKVVNKEKASKKIPVDFK